MRLIDADALEKAIYEWMPKDQETWTDSGIPPIENLVVSIMMTIQEQPTIDAEPVRHGKWWRYPLEQLGFPEHVYMMRQCSECKKVFDQKWNYCPNCGAKMNMKRKEE